MRRIWGAIVKVTKSQCRDDKEYQTSFKKSFYHTANPVPVMKTGILCAQILTGKTCSHYRDPVLP